MNFPETLTPDQRRRGQKMLRRFMRFNGTSVAFLMENMLILYAIRNGLSDPQVAVLASFIHLTMPFMILGKRMVSSLGSAKTWSLCWVLRYALVFIIFFAPFVPPEHQWGRAAIIMFGSLGYAIFRSMGIVNNSPLQGDITTPQERGRFLSRNIFNTHLAYFIAMAAIILVLWYWDSLRVYQFFIVLGCVAGFGGSYFLSKIPESKKPSESASKPIISSIELLWKTPSLRRMLYAWCAGFVLFAMTLPFSVITLKNGYGIPDHLAMIFSLMIIGGAVVSSLFNGFFADLVGPRPLIILYAFGFFIVDAFWAFAPADFMPGLTLFVFFLGGFCKVGVLVGLSHYLLVHIGEMERVGISLLVRALSGAAGGLAGSVVGASLLSILQNRNLAVLDVYRTYFRIIAALLIVMVIILYRLERLKEWRLKHIIGLFFSLRDLQALFVINKMEQANSFNEDAENIGKLETIGSNISEDKVREYLGSPDIAVRGRALRALRQIDFGSETVLALRRELERGVHTTAWLAAEILGEHGITEAIPDLRKTLSSEDILLRGKSMTALVRLKDGESIPRIVQFFRESDNPRILLYGSQALLELNDPRHVPILLEKALKEDLPEAVKDQLYMALAVICGVPRAFYSFLREYRQDSLEGISYLFSLIEGNVDGILREKAREEAVKKIPGREVPEEKSKPGKSDKPNKPPERETSLRKLLLDLAERSEAPHGAPVKEFLSAHLETVLPGKMEFFLILALYDRDKRKSEGFLSYSVD